MWLLALVALPLLALPILAMVFVDYAFGRWGEVQNDVGLNGVEVAQRIRATAQLPAAVEMTSLEDHYDPRSDIVRLNEKTASRSSVLALAVAAHEMGHAQQQLENPAMIRYRNLLVPLIQLSPTASYGLVAVGLLLRFYRLIWFGAGLFGLVVVFMLLTLPIEIDASRRGMRLLRRAGLLNNSRDRRGAIQVLSAAALTYVSASVLSLRQLWRYIQMARLG